MFDSLIGNEAVKERLTRMIANNRVGQSLLFAGPAGIGKGLFAEELARSLVSTTKDFHPDIHSFRPQGKSCMHSIDAMRALADDVTLSPMESKKKVFIIHDAERMLPTSQNALLKTFEEPTQGTHIILVSSHHTKLLPTILSRCQTVRFIPIPEADIAAFLTARGETEEEAATAAHLANGSLQAALDNDLSIRHAVLDILAAKTRNWTALSDSVKALAEMMARPEEAIENAKELTAAAREHAEKEADGKAAIGRLSDADRAFSVILSWYRDLELTAIDPKSPYLINRDVRPSGRALPLEEVESAIRRAKIALDRSTPVAHTFEHLFLTLQQL